MRAISIPTAVLIIVSLLCIGCLPEQKKEDNKPLAVTDEQRWEEYSIAVQAEADANRRMPRVVGPNVLASWMQSNNILVFDVQPEAVRKQKGYITGSIPIGGKEITRELLRSEQDMIRVFAGIDKNDPAAVQAYEKARELGFKEVFMLYGGTEKFLEMNNKDKE